MPQGRSNIAPSSSWMEEAIRKVRGENPDVANTSIEPAGMISGPILKGLGASGITNPLTGSIYYDPAAYQGMNPGLRENSLTHEMTHSRQIGNQSYLDRLMTFGKSLLPSSTPYLERPNEMGAFQSERDRSLRLGLDTPDPVSGARDIQLNKPRKKKAIAPSGY
jgi:hypothetical protein